MKKVGNIVFCIGMTAFILGACGYDAQPLFCGIVSLVGIAAAYVGYRIDGEYVDYDKEK